LNTNLTAGMRQFIAEHDWLIVIQLPAYAPQLNPSQHLFVVSVRQCSDLLLRHNHRIDARFFGGSC